MLNLLLAVEVIDVITLTISGVVLLLVGVSFFIKTKVELNTEDIIKEQERNLRLLGDEQSREFENVMLWFKTYSEGQKELIKSYNESIAVQINEITKMQKEQLGTTNAKLRELIISNEQKLDKMTMSVENSLSKMMQSNELKLEQMRKTVDEKLDESLERRFNQSFEMMSKQFEYIGEQLGEMKSITSSVSDLQKILTNVKTRGTFGEVQLANLLEQMLAPNQYASQVQVKEGDKRGGVDFAINLPGKDDQNILLPIDAKFPVEDYLRLVEASEQGNVEEVKKYRKAITASIKKEAKSISQKYINPPLTTNFAILYVATEGMYSELLQNSGLIEELQREYRVIISGPTTFSAMLNSLQMGFKTLSIQKHSTEIWNALTSFKKDFGLFTNLLLKTQKKVGEVSNTIEEATKRTQIITKKLDKVASIALPNEKTELLDNLKKKPVTED